MDPKLLDLILDNIKELKSEIKDGFTGIRNDIDELKQGYASMDHCSKDLRADLDAAFNRIRELESRTIWLDPVKKISLWLIPIVALAVAGYVGKTVIPMVLKQEIQRVVVLPKTDTTGGKKK